MKESTRFFAPLAAVFAFMLGLQWVTSMPADAGAPVPDTVTTSPFEYFPGQFVLNAGEAGEHIPTF